jgi:hypothetical protein
MLFHLKIKIKAIFSTRRQLLLYVARRAPCLFCFEAICDRYFFKLNCFKLSDWFNHHHVFPPIRSVRYRFLHCDYRKLHCDYKKLHSDYRKLHCDYSKLHCCLGLTALNQSQSSNIFMYIISMSIVWGLLAGITFSITILF